MTSISPGTPNWVDLGTPDVADARRFYTGLFGWTEQVVPRPGGGEYVLFAKDGRTVAGAGPLEPPDGLPATWTTFMATDEVDGVVRRVVDAGGEVLLAPVDLAGQARLAMFRDVSGAAFGAWQPMAMPEAELLNSPGALSWTELTTRDPEGARAFYGAVFGWQSRETPMDPAVYTTWLVDGREVAGMMPMVGDEWPATLPAHWMVYFAVDDTDRAAARATRLGGAVSVPPTDIPQGRFAVLNDPQDAVFSVIRPSRS